MSIEKLSENILLVTLADEFQFVKDLESINEMVSKGSYYDVIVDFCEIAIGTSSVITNLLLLRKMLLEHDYRLILCKMSVLTQCAFTTLGIHGVFDIIDEKADAIESLQHSTDPKKDSTNPSP